MLVGGSWKNTVSNLKKAYACLFNNPLECSAVTEVGHKGRREELIIKGKISKLTESLITSE